MNELLEKERHLYNFEPEKLWIATLVVLILIIGFTTNVSWWGNKQVAIFDVWSFGHIFFGAVLGTIAISLRRQAFVLKGRECILMHPFILVLLISVSWETVEHYLEIASTPFIMNWFGGQETFANRMLADQLCVILGYTLVKAIPRWYIEYAIVGVLFYAFHIWAGSSMFFH